MAGDSVKTEGQDYVRVTIPVPGPVAITSYVHGEFSHMFTARERSTWGSKILEKQFLYETITSGWSHA